MVNPVKFTSGSGWLARYGFLVISEGYHVDLLICSFLVVGHRGLKMKKWLTNSQFEVSERITGSAFQISFHPDW